MEDNMEDIFYMIFFSVRKLLIEDVVKLDSVLGREVLENRLGLFPELYEDNQGSLEEDLFVFAKVQFRGINYIFINGLTPDDWGGVFLTTNFKLVVFVSYLDLPCMDTIELESFETYAQEVREMPDDPLKKWFYLAYGKEVVNSIMDRETTNPLFGGGYPY